MAGKGSAYERVLCKRLSRWWTHGKYDDVFWRSAASGGRAKVRGRRGLRTYGHHGDICATDPIGQPLIDLFTIEIKRGYSRNTLYDLIDAPASAAEQPTAKWLFQAMESWQHSGSWSWMLIHKRDQRDPIVMLPEEACVELEIDVVVQSCASFYLSYNNQIVAISVLPLAYFLRHRLQIQSYATVWQGSKEPC